MRMLSLVRLVGLVRARRIGALAVLSILATATIETAAPRDAHAQDAAKPPKKKKPAATPAPTGSPATETPPAPPPTAPEPAPAAATESAPPVSEESKMGAMEPPPPEWDNKDVLEKPGKTYMFVGLRYTHTVIPKFLLNAFVAEGETFHSNTIGVAADIRKDGFSLIPALSFAEYSTGDVLFLQKNVDAKVPGNWSMVNSSLKALYFTADLLWSANISKNWDFEYGAGFGLGIIFGDLETNWVHRDPNGPLTASDGARWSQCKTVNDGAGCALGDHQNATTAKVGGYTEPSWANGGSKPNLFPHVAFPQIGIRYKPIKQFEARAIVGFSLTGFFLGINLMGGLEHKVEEKK